MRFSLDEQREQVIVALSRSMRGNQEVRSALLGVKGRALVAATAANRSVASSSTLPAIDRYTGVLYDALDHRSLAISRRRRLQECVCIFSGLWGLVAPLDPIPDYKLKMGASLGSLGRLSRFWRPAVSGALAQHGAGRRVWNLLPKEHDAAWDAPAGLEQLSVRFLERRPDGTLKAVSHWNKFLKGVLVRYLLAEPSTDAWSLENWRHPSGYQLDPALTQTLGASTVLSFVQEGRPT